MEETNNRPAVKVVLIGNSGAGKTSLAQRFVYDKFNVYSESTIGASFFTKTISVNAKSSDQQEELPDSKSSGKETCDEGMDSKRIKFHVWDTAGQEKYHSLGHLYYRGAIAAVLVYDICNAPSYDALASWLKRLKECGPEGLIKIIVGNKCDLQDQRQMMKETAELFALKENCVYLETSARDNVNVEQIFQEIAKLLPDDCSQQKTVSSDGQVLRLGSTSPSTRQYCGC